MNQYDALEIKYLVKVIEYMQRDMRTIAKELHELNKKLDVHLGLMSVREFYEHTQKHGIPVCNELKDILNKEEI